MNLISKEKRYWLLGGASAVVLVMVWWAQVYSPAKEQRDELAVEHYKVKQERERLELRKEQLSAEAQAPAENQQSDDTPSSLLVPGQDPEEICGHLQMWLQEFTADHDMSVTNYRALTPTRWRDYSLCGVEFQMNGSMQGLSDLLESLDRMKQAIRIERLNVDYRRSREKSLRISLELGALFVEGIER